MYRTQKAKGIATLLSQMPFADYGLSARYLDNYSVRIWPHSHIRYPDELPLFARPCPTVPRHGFVESRLVSTLEEVQQVIAETKAADPDGEVIFMNRLSGKWSGIATHAGIVFGPKNDGATSGHDAKTIPAYVEPLIFNERAVYWNYLVGAGIHNAAYLEFVEDDNRPVFVQLRDGPKIPQSLNYIPRRIEVRQVVPVQGEDLLEWEAKIAQFVGQEGVVVYHPHGALSSHYSVHAITHEIPVIIQGRRPRVGQVLEPEGPTPPRLMPRHYRAIAEMLKARFKTGYRTSPKKHHMIVKAAIAAMHAQPLWGPDDHLLRLRAEGIAATLIFTTAACMGEMRHWYRVGPGVDEDTRRGNHGTSRVFSNIHPQRADLINLTPEQENIERNDVYTTALRRPVRDLHEWLTLAERDFNRSDWVKGYGGPLWADACKTTAKMFDAVRRFIRAPNRGNWTRVVSHWNQTINACHNNGKILTKWVMRDTMDDIALCPGPAFISNFVARLVLDLDQLPVVQENELVEFLEAA